MATCDVQAALVEFEREVAALGEGVYPSTKALAVLSEKDLKAAIEEIRRRRGDAASRATKLASQTQRALNDLKTTRRMFEVARYAVIERMGLVDDLVEDSFQNPADLPAENAITRAIKLGVAKKTNVTNGTGE